MKISVCLSGDDIRFIDEYAESRGEISRSAVIRSAIRLLREEDLGEQYSAAFAEWQEGGEDKVWASVPGDGIEPEPPEAR